MKSFFALYAKELKVNSPLFLFLLLFVMGMSAYGLSRMVIFVYLLLGSMP